MTSESAAPQRTRRVLTAVVLRREQLTPHMIRVVLGGPDLRDFPAGAFTDHYVKLLFPPAGVRYPRPFDLAAIRQELPREDWPRTRTYTVRRWDRATGELTLDFVYHGDEGLAGPWAASVQPGEELHFMGPGGKYAPSVDAGWHLLVGDESALPAIAAAVEALPPGAVAKAFVEVADAQEEQWLESAGDVEIAWLHRGRRQIGDLLLERVTAMAFPAGRVQAFVHGEANFVKALRRHLLAERGLTADQLSISGYWRRGADEDNWQATKADFDRQA
jgi:NADPH-dependent ferric siderophore reductase